MSGESAESQSASTDAGFDASICETRKWTHPSANAAIGLRPFDRSQQRTVNAGCGVCNVGYKDSGFSRSTANAANDHGPRHDRTQLQPCGVFGTNIQCDTRCHTGNHCRNATLIKAAITAKLRWLQAILFLIVLLTPLARHWWILDILANLRVQWLVGSATAVLLAVILQSPKDTARCLLLTTFLAWPLLPGIMSGTSASNADPTKASVLTGIDDRLRVCVCNVLSSNRRHDDTLHALTERDPDVIGILELSPELADLCHSNLRERWPHQMLVPQATGNFGIGVLSKTPLRDGFVFQLNEPWIPSIEVTVGTADCSLRLFVTHPLPPVGHRKFLSRNQHLQMLASRAAAHQQANPEHGILVIGDLNLTPWSPIFDDWLAASRLKNASAGFGFMPTWFRIDHPVGGLMLDHACCSDDLVCMRRIVSGPFGSDHRAVTFDFCRGKSSQPALD